jgi:SAM-dependent methyltransferase
METLHQPCLDKGDKEVTLTPSAFSTQGPQTGSEKEVDSMQEAVTVAMSHQPYGEYILRTGTDIIRQAELVYGAYWYETRFAGKTPILDLGPGRCWFTKQNTDDIVAVDNAPTLVEYHGQRGINIRLGDPCRIPYPEEYFEGVFCCWLLEHLSEPHRAISEMYRILKPGGYACVVVPSPDDMTAFYDDYTHVRPYTPTALKQLAEDCGFTRYRIEFLPWVRGISHVLRFLGSGTAIKYMYWADRYLRKLYLVSWNNLMLEAWR